MPNEDVTVSNDASPKRCLFCYEPLNGGPGTDYHAKCSSWFFETPEPPELPYTLGEISVLAEQIVRSSITVPGVQPKLSLHLERPARRAHGSNAPHAARGVTNRLTIVGLWGSYIFKPPTGEYPELPEVEDCTMHLAEIVGIQTVPHSLIRFKSGELAYITKRIDRTGKGERVHMEDMCQLTGRLTEDKYHGSVEQIGKAILAYSSNPGLDVINFFEVVLFSYLTGNADMHLKNYSLLHTTLAGERAIALAPAYDLIATKLLIPADTEDTALPINGKKAKLGLCDFNELAGRLGINEKARRNSYERIHEQTKAMQAFIEKSFLAAQTKGYFIQLIQEKSQIFS